ncbi:MAG: zf-HC2 domain-containing protein [Kofleriaceae bacterium]|nr:zf-HC2 domain-containing protein [Kofleriaceae bacterium]
MRCITVKKHSSAYLDGELEAGQSSAIRGHLRICEACQQCYEEEAGLIAAASELQPLDPPDHLWQGILSQIADAEIADSEEVDRLPVRRAIVRRAIRRIIPANWRLHAIGATSLAIAMALLYADAGSQKPSQMAAGTADTRVEQGDTQQAAVLAPKATETRELYAPQLALTIEDADRDYLQTIADLRTILEEDRSSWTNKEARILDAELATFKRIGIGTRLAMSETSVESRDELYAHYQLEISFLESALMGELSGNSGSTH